MSFITPEKNINTEYLEKEIIDGTIFLGINKNNNIILITSPGITFLFFSFLSWYKARYYHCGVLDLEHLIGQLRIRTL